MKKILITGSEGFLGRNLIAHLSSLGDFEISGVDVATPRADLESALLACEIIVHLAGVNRPPSPDQFLKGNRDFTADLCDILRRTGCRPIILFSSSIQAGNDTPYGLSKRAAEEIFQSYADECNASVVIYRLKNVFGKWSRPNYNSVVATFCHNLANDLPIQVSDPDRLIDLVYVDDVVDRITHDLHTPANAGCVLVDGSEIPSFAMTIGELAGTLQSYRDMHRTLLIPDFSIAFHRQLYATYQSYVPTPVHQFKLEVKRDNRGSLAELLKSPHAGQVFVSRTLPGVVRGNHFHHTKTEKFVVLEGEAFLRMRQILSPDVLEYHLRGTDYQVVDIPPGFTHSLENVGKGELVTLFWASEIFDPNRSDTYHLHVLQETAAPSLEVK